MAVVRQIREQLVNHQMPTDSLGDGVLILIASALLIAPGLITDMMGISILIPPIRRWYRRQLFNWFKRRFRFTTIVNGQVFESDDSVVDSYVVREKQAIDESSDRHNEYPK